MIQIARILCPVDFSQCSRRALDHAVAMAGWYGARLTVLHVAPNRPVMDLPAARLGDEERERITRDLARMTAHVPSDVSFDLQLHEASDVARDIISEAEAVEADLIVIGSHGRSGFERLLLGSVAEQVLRKARCPTMVVPRRASETAADEPVRFRRILCPVDFSRGSLGALAYALNIAEGVQAQLTLMHVVEPPDTPPFGKAVTVATRTAAESDWLRRLIELVPEASRTHCTVKAVVREGPAYELILKTARERSIDAIVMGMQGRGAIEMLVFGSNTVRVMRAAGCPVLIVRPGAKVMPASLDEHVQRASSC